MSFQKYSIKKIEHANKNNIFIGSKKYFDLSLHSGVLLLGHNHPIFLKTLKEIISQKISLSNIKSDNINKILSLIKFYFKSAYKLIFCTTGSESVIKTIRICKSITKNKNKIFLVSGGWHGSVDQTLFHSNKSLNPMPLSSGLDKNIKKKY